MSAQTQAGGTDGLDDEMARELLAHYLGGAKERIALVKAAAQAVRTSPTDANALETLRIAVHKIAGSAGTYGFDHLGATAKALEKRVLAARGDRCPEETLAAADDLCNLMEEQFAEARRTGRAPTGATAESQPARGTDDLLVSPSFWVEPSEPAAAQPTLAASVVPVASAAGRAPISPPAVPAPARHTGRRPALGILAGGVGTTQTLEAELGAALAGAGAHLILAGSLTAAHGFRGADAEGLVLAPCAVGGTRDALVDVALPPGGVTAAMDGAVLVGGGPQALIAAGELLAAGKPLVALVGSGGVADLLAGHEFEGARVHRAGSPMEAVFLLLSGLAYS